jgi:hypothetical protein
MTKEDLVCAPVCATHEETLEAALEIMKATDPKSRIGQLLNIIRYNGHHIKNNIRSIHIRQTYQRNNQRNKIVPQITMQGQWLHIAGFEPGNRVWVIPFPDVLIAVPQGPKSIPKG